MDANDHPSQATSAIVTPVRAEEWVCPSGFFLLATGMGAVAICEGWHPSRLLILQLRTSRRDPAVRSREQSRLSRGIARDERVPAGTAIMRGMSLRGAGLA